MKAFRVFIPIVLLSIVVAILPSSSLAQVSSTDQARADSLQKQLDELRAQMSVLQEQIEQLKAAPGAATTAAPTPGTAPVSASLVKQEAAAAEVELKSDKQAQVGKAVSQYETFSQDPLAAPRLDNAPLDPRYPGYFRLPGTRTFLRIGGYFKTDFVYDLKPAGEPEKFLPSTIPVPSQGSANNATVSIRPTRMNVDFLIPTETLDNVRFFLEADLFGTNSTTPRLRHAYAQVKNLLVGQSFSNFMDPDSGPDQLEFQGPNGQVSIRTPQLRYSLKLAKSTSLRLSVEKPSSDVTFKTADSISCIANSPAPDGAVTLRHDYESGHLQLSGVFRSISAYLPDGRSDSVFGSGVNFTGSQHLIGKDTFVYQGAYGYGIERYINDTSGLGIDAGLENAANPHLKALPVIGTYGSYQHFWASRIRSSAFYGFTQVQNSDLQTSSVFHRSHYSGANLIWNPIGSLNIGTEFLYGWQVKKNGASGNAPRFMFSAKYNFVQMKAPEKNNK